MVRFETVSDGKHAPSPVRPFLPKPLTFGGLFPELLFDPDQSGSVTNTDIIECNKRDTNTIIVEFGNNL